MNLDSAISIGLLPRLPNAKYVQVGNAAGVGAKMALLSLKERQRAQQIMKRTGYIELTTQAGFNNRFALSMLFPMSTTPGSTVSIDMKLRLELGSTSI